jgi:hypothetical protein
MGLEVLVLALAPVLSALAGLISQIDFIKKLLRTLGGMPAPIQKTYSERLSALTTSLTKASDEVDSVLQEMASVIREREKSVKALEEGLPIWKKQRKNLRRELLCYKTYLFRLRRNLPNS